MSVTPLEILYIHDTDIAQNIPSETFVIYNALSLVQQGAKVTLMLTSRSETDPKDIIKRKFNWREWPTKLNLVITKLGGKGHWRFYRQAAKVTRESTSLIVITRCHSVLPHLFFAVRRQQKLYFETHDFFYDRGIRDDLPHGKRRKQAIIEKLFFSRLSGLICLNKSQKELYSKYLSVPIQVFPTGLNKQDIVRKDPGQDILYVGSLEKRKGVEHILRLAKYVSHGQILIAGGKTEEERLDFSQRVREEGLQEKVKMLGWMTKSDLETILASVSFGLIPLKDTFFNRFLTVPLKLFDYYAFGVPVVATDLPSLKAFIRDNETGFFTDWKEPEKIYARIIGALKDPGKWLHMHQKVNEEARILTWQKRAEDQITFFQRELNSGA